MYIQRQAGLFLRCLTTALVSLAYRPSKSVTNEAEVVCSEITDQLALLARSQRQITSPPVIYTIPAHTMSCLFEEHKKGCNDHSLYPPCWLTAPWGGSVRPAPSAPQNFWKDHYLWRLFFFFFFFWHDIELHNQSLLAWACESLTMYLTKWAVWYCLRGGVLPGQNYQTAAWGGPISLILNAQNQHRRKAQEMPGLQFNVMEMTTETILTHIPHYIDCTCMSNCHLLFSLALSRQEQDTARESMTDPTNWSGKWYFLMTLYLGSRRGTPFQVYFWAARRTGNTGRGFGGYFLVHQIPEVTAPICGLSPVPCSVSTAAMLPGLRQESPLNTSPFYSTLSHPSCSLSVVTL